MKNYLIIFSLLVIVFFSIFFVSKAQAQVRTKLYLVGIQNDNGEAINMPRALGVLNRLAGMHLNQMQLNSKIAYNFYTNDSNDVILSTLRCARHLDGIQNPGMIGTMDDEEAMMHAILAWGNQKRFIANNAPQDLSQQFLNSNCIVLEKNVDPRLGLGEWVPATADEEEAFRRAVNKLSPKQLKRLEELFDQL